MTGPPTRRRPAGQPGTVQDDRHLADQVTAHSTRGVQHLGVTASNTSGDTLRFLAGRRRPSRYWAATLDGAELADALAEATGSRLAARALLREALHKLEPAGVVS